MNLFPIATVTAAPSPATSGTSVTVDFPTRIFTGLCVAAPAGTVPTLDNAEGILVTAINTGTGVCTITRNQNSSSAQNIAIGWVIYNLSWDLLAGVTVSGTPSSGQALIATSATAASWSAPSGVNYVGISRPYESIDNALFNSPTGSATVTIDNSLNDGLTFDTGTTLNSSAQKVWDMNSGARGDMFTGTVFGYWGIATQGLATSSTADCYLRWYSSSNDPTVGTADQIGLSLGKVAGAVNPLTSTGDGTTQQTTAISGVTFTSGKYHRYYITYDGTSVSFYVDGVLKNTQSANVPRRLSTVVSGYNSLIYIKNTTTDVYRLIVSNYSLMWPANG